MKRTTWAAFLSLTQIVSPALAQTATSPAEPVPTDEAQSVPTQNDVPAPSGAASSAQAAPVIDVADPMLEPIEAPEHTLVDWRDALQHIRDRSTNYRSTLAQVEIARGQSRIALANVLPTLIGTGNLQHHLIYTEITPSNPRFNTQTGEIITNGKLPDPGTNWNLGATLRVPLLSARNWYDYATSRKAVEQAELQAADAERMIIGGLAESLVTVITAERLAEVTRVNLAAALSNLELNKKRAQLGSGNAIDVLRARQEVESSRAQVVEADEAVRKSREALGQALGYPEAWGVTPDIKMDQLRQDARDTCKLGKSIQDRSDVRAAAVGAAIAERNEKSVNFAYLPTIDGVSTFTYYSLVVPTNRKRYTWTIGAQLTWHLYDGGLRYGQKTLNAGLAEQSRQNSIQIERNAAIEVRQAVRGVTVAQRSLEVARQSAEIAENNANLARAKFLNGTGSSFDLVDTQRSARQTKLDTTVKEFELLRAEIIAFLALASCEI